MTLPHARTNSALATGRLHIANMPKSEPAAAEATANYNHVGLVWRQNRSPTSAQICCSGCVEPFGLAKVKSAVHAMSRGPKGHRASSFNGDTGMLVEEE